MRVSTENADKLALFLETPGRMVGRLTVAPDAGQIAFTLFEGDPNDWFAEPTAHIWLSHIDGTGQRVLTVGRSPTWRPTRRE